MKKYVLVLAAAIFSLVLIIPTAGCSSSGGSSSGGDENIAVQKLELAEHNFSLVPGETFELGVNIYPENATNKEIVWTYDNTYLEIDKSQMPVLVRAKDNFSSHMAVQITASTKDGRLSDSAVVDIYPNSPYVTLSDIKFTLEEEDSRYVNATFSDSYDCITYWNSSDYSVADVDSWGDNYFCVYACSAGTAIITIHTSSGYETSCKVIVKEPPAPNTTITIDIEKSSDIGDLLYSESGSNIKFTAPSGYSKYKWFVDDEFKSEGSVYLLYKYFLSTGKHSVMVIIDDLYAASYILTVE